MATVKILKKTKTQATIKVVGNGNVTITAEDIKTPEQTVDTANLSYPITSVIFNLKNDAKINRNGNAIIEFIAGSYDDWAFSQDYGISLNDDANANVDIVLGAGHNTMIFQVSKEAGFIEPNQQILQPRDR